MKVEKVKEWANAGWLNDEELRKQILKWERYGQPVPPPHRVKQAVITKYQEKHQLPVLVETGTFRGDMMEAQRKFFDKLYSIELSEKLWRDAKTRFKNEAKIELLQGDSGVVMKELCKTLTDGALFWLDGHYSAGVTALGEKECPILEELNTILLDRESIRQVILIDDARLFVGKNDYPTIPELKDFVANISPQASISVEDDIIRITAGHAFNPS